MFTRLDYAPAPAPSREVAKSRRERRVYAAGVALLWAALVVA